MTQLVAFIDVETTGLSSVNDEVIELGVMLGRVENNRITRIFSQYCEFQEPSLAIPPHITGITGITDDMVAGKRLDLERVYAILHKADAIVAHNASFDRGFVDKLIPGIAQMNWYCSVHQIKWKEFGFANGKLQQLLSTQGINVMNAHRALDDAVNLAKLLNFTHPKLVEDNTYLSYLTSKNPIKQPARLRI